MGLLIIDEAHELGRDALEAMRTIHDRTSIGLVLQGNEQVYTAMTGGNRAAYLDRLFSRIGKRVRIVKPTARDIDSLIQAWGGGKDCAKVLHEIAAKPGGLRGMTKITREPLITFSVGFGPILTSVVTVPVTPSITRSGETDRLSLPVLSNFASVVKFCVFI
jgi:DNA transposition AAA+ family ATPase